MGFKRKILVPVPCKKAYFTKKAYSMFENYFHEHCGFLYIKERMLFSEKLGLNLIDAKRFLFINRKNGMKRHFISSEEIFACIKKNFVSYN